MTTRAYKAFTQSLCPPIQGGDPVWDGTLPYTLPEVVVDTSNKVCAEGWNAAPTPEDALQIAGLWRGGRPVRLFRVETDHEVIEREDKLRAASWTITEELSIEEGVRKLSARWFEPQHVERMVQEQLAWHRALGRPQRDEAAVVGGLEAALRHRGFDWQLRRYESALAAWDAWYAWDASAAWAARAAWDAWNAWYARAAWAAWYAWDAWDASAASAAWGAWGARAARAARAARGALAVFYASLMGWIEHPADLLTVGIRDAYEHGLGIACPTGPAELGWAMDEATS